MCSGKQAPAVQLFVEAMKSNELEQWYHLLTSCEDVSRPGDVMRQKEGFEVARDHRRSSGHTQSLVESAFTL